MLALIRGGRAFQYPLGGCHGGFLEAFDPSATLSALLDEFEGWTIEITQERFGRQKLPEDAKGILPVKTSIAEEATYGVSVL